MSIFFNNRNVSGCTGNVKSRNLAFFNDISYSVDIFPETMLHYVELTSLLLSYRFQFMKKANNPLVQMHNYLIRQATHMQHTKLINSDSIFGKRLEYIKEVGSIEIPPASFLSFKSTSFGKSLVCEAFTLTNWFPNNFAIVRSARGQAHVILVKDIKFDKNNDPYLVGPVFSKQESLYEIRGLYDFRQHHCYKVSGLQSTSQSWSVKERLIAKGFALDLAIDAVNGKGNGSRRPLPKFNSQAEWVVQSLMHSCDT